MIDRSLTVVPENGLHARPAARFVSTASQYDSVIEVSTEDGEPVDASSMLAVTGLNVRSGERVTLSVDGPDEDAAFEALEEILTTPEEE
ncbi:HPr family phosphocarrier protein [Natronorubrum halophilum]|uniref:HPr family phosphocarrier protein n=1 Tax=Natronorubrum halophilum TaxID=1702106 RepID=UPI000EF6BDBC|nr:HPr family phosphocarrier protein [Natronorubrum halophilum]